MCVVCDAYDAVLINVIAGVSRSNGSRPNDGLQLTGRTDLKYARHDSAGSTECKCAWMGAQLYPNAFDGLAGPQLTSVALVSKKPRCYDRTRVAC